MKKTKPALSGDSLQTSLGKTYFFMHSNLLDIHCSAIQANSPIAYKIRTTEIYAAPSFYTWLKIYFMYVKFALYPNWANER